MLFQQAGVEFDGRSDRACAQNRLTNRRDGFGRRFARWIPGTIADIASTPPARIVIWRQTGGTAVDIRYFSENAARGAKISARMRRNGFTPSGYRIWSSSEEAFLRLHYPDAAKIQRRLQHRTIGAIQAKAFKLGLTKKSKPWTGAKIILLRKVWVKGSRDDVRKAFPDYSWGRLYSKASSLRLRRPSQHRPAGHQLIEVVRARARSLDMTLTDVDQLTNNRSYFKNSCRKKNPYIEPLLRAIEALDGHIEIVWH